MKNTIRPRQQTPLPGSFKKPVSNSRGIFLVYLVVVIFIFGVLGVSLVSLFSTATQSGATPNDARRARYIAESGIRYALSEIRNTDNFVDTAQKLNETENFKLGKNGSFNVNVFSPGLESAESKLIGFLGGSIDLDVPHSGEFPDNFTIPNISLVYWEDFEGTTPPSTSYAVISDFTIADPPESVSIDVADDFDAKNVGDTICFALQATDADTRIEEGEFIDVAKEAADLFPAEGGAIRILANGIKYDYYYEKREPPVSDKVRLTNLRALPGGDPWTDIINLNASDYVILSPNNFRLLASGTSNDIIIEIGKNKPYWAFAPPLATGYTIYMDELLDANTVNQYGDVVRPNIGEEKIELGAGGGGSEGFGDLWYSGNKSIGGYTDRCKQGRCKFGEGIRTFFTAKFSGDGEGFTFSLIAGGNEADTIVPSPNTNFSVGGDFQLPELLAYGGASLTGLPSPDTYKDGSGEGLKAPKIALEFDTRTDYSSPPLDYCTANNINLIPGSRNDPQPNGLDMDVMQYVFWGSNDISASILSCRSVGRETYDDNRHDAEGEELSPNWGFDIGTGSVSSPAIDKTGGDYDGTIYVAANQDEVFAFKPDGTLKWNRDLSNDTMGSPAVGSDGTVFIGDESGYLYALQPWNGLNAHSYFDASGAIRSRPAIDSSDNVYFGTTQGFFYKLADNLVKQWKYTVDDNADLVTGGAAPIKTSPALSDNEKTIYFGTDDSTSSNFYALDLTKVVTVPDAPDNVKWKINKGDSDSGTPDHIRSSPAVDMTTGQDHSGYIYFGTDNTVSDTDVPGRIFAIEPINGDEEGSFSSGDKILSSPAVDDDGNIYVGSDDHEFYALEVGAGGSGLSEKWSDDDPPVGVARSGPAVNPNDGLQKGTIYVGTKNKNVLAYYPNGDLKWQFKGFTGKEGTHPEDQIDADPAVGKDDFVYVGDIDDNLYSLATVSLPRNYRSDHPDFHEVPSGKADNNDYEINHKAHITHRDLGPGLNLTDENDWLNGGNLFYPWAVRMEVEKIADRTYELKTWIRQCTVGDCSDIKDTLYQNTERKYNFTPSTLEYPDSTIKTIPLIQTIVLDSAGDVRDELFERVLFGFTTAAGSSDTQLIDIRDFQLTFISAFEDGEIPADPDWVP